MKKPFAISLFLMFILLTNHALAITVSSRVSSSNDDGEEQNPSNNTVYRNSTDLELAYDGNTRQHIGMRFQSLAIPQGATINSAYIEFEVDETDSGTTNVVIFGQATDDAGTFGNGANNISNRTRTSASVNWSIPAWNVVSAKQQSPDITVIIQEIVNRSGWSSGNDMAIIIEPGAGCNSSSCQRTAESEDGESANAPLLVIDYTTGGSGASCETFRDEFSTESYSRQDGTMNWSIDWIETGDNGNVSNGDIEISGGVLQLEGDGSGGGHAAFSGDPSIEREADLSAYTSATLSFNYYETGNWEGNDDIDIYISSNGGGSWTLLRNFNNDQGSTAQLLSEDITTYISSSTRIAFVERANANNEIFYFDNVEIEACSSGTPTVDPQVTSDTTPIVTGTYNSAGSAGGFTVTLNAVTYTLGVDTELSNSGDDWTLDLSTSTPLPIGIYEVVATSDDGAGNTVSDTTSNELEIIAPVCTATYRDEFTSASFGNNDGDTNFSANWDEFEGSSLTVPEASPDPLNGHVQISGGELVLHNYSPESANAPGVERQLDLTGMTSATFSFDFRTFGGVDGDDSLLVQASANGGTSWNLLENITGIGDTSGSRSYDLTPYISSNTKIRLRFNTTINTGACCYGGAGETIAIDNINIDASGSCPTVDHYAISHGGVGITCEAEAVTVTAHDASHVAVIPTSSTTVTLTTSIANDGWALRTGNGTFTPPNQYTFDGVESSVEFWLTKLTATTAPHMDIDVTDGSATDPDDGGVEDAVLEFRETAFRFYADGVNNAIGPQIAGKWSNDTSGIQALTLRAVQTNTDTMACEARVTGPLTVPMAFECIDPTNCKTNNGVTLIDSVIGGPGDTLNDNPQGGPIVYSNVDLTFDATGTASWIMKYDDAGQIRLHANLTLPASPPDPADTLSGISNTFTSSPAGICVSTSDANASCDPANASCSAFKKAGETFNLDIRAVAWQSSGENNTDFCAGNPTTPNFQFSNLALGHNLLAPVGAPGSIGVNLFDMIAADDGDHNISNQTVSEVGVFSFFTPDLSYFGETILSSTSANIGRFYPDHFVLSDPQLTNRSDLGCASAFTYMDENFQTSFDLEARNVGGTVTQNYTTASGFAKLNTEAELNFGAVDLSGPTDLTARLAVGTPDVINFIAGVADADTGLADTLTDDLMLNRLTVAPYTDGAYALRVGVAPQDDDGVILNSYDLDVNGGGNDHAEIGSTLIYYGRQIVSNAHGSELQPLTIGLKTQRFDGVSFSFVTNDLDNCSAYNVTDINLAAATYTAPLTDTDLGLTGSGLFIAGIASFSMHDDTVATVGPGVTGDVTYNMVVPTYLQYDWDSDLVFTDDPSAKATFGIFNGNSKQIYFRQIYQ